MSDIKDNEEFNDEFVDDLEAFDIDDTAVDPEIEATAPSTKKLDNKKILAIATIAVLVIFIMIRNFISENNAEKNTVKPAIASNNIEQSADAETTETDENFSFDDIKKLQEAEVAKSDSTATPQPTKPAVFNNISELQRELFTEQQQANDAAIAKETTQESGEPDQMNKTLSNLNMLITKHMAQNNKLERTLSHISSTLQKVNNNISGVSSNSKQLSQQADELSDDVQALKRAISDDDLALTAKIANEKQNQPLVYDGPEYSVHAIIPGRAWLKSKQGQIITVTEGDKIGNYGKIVVIDASNGIVLTGSGIAFK